MTGQEAAYVDPLADADDDTHWRAWNRIVLDTGHAGEKAEVAKQWNSDHGGHATSNVYLSRWHKAQKIQQPNAHRVWGEQLKEEATFSTDDLNVESAWQKTVDIENRAKEAKE